MAINYRDQKNDKGIILISYDLARNLCELLSRDDFVWNYIILGKLNLYSIIIIIIIKYKLK